MLSYIFGEAMSFWIEFGFSSSPYATKPIPANANGDGLLVGRDKEIEQLISRLQSTTRHPTVEGPVGVGKTSLISVASFRMKSAFKNGRASYNSLIPLDEPIELSPQMTVESFQNEIFYKVADGFKLHRNELEATGRRIPKQDDIAQWIHRPVFGTKVAGLNTPLAGISLGKGKAPTSSPAYSAFGFPKAMKSLLENCFPNPGHGGFVAIVDNLELMRTSQNVRDVLDLMRDNVLAQAGLRWILCGARGVVRSAASTERLADTLLQPIEVKPISDELMSEVISRRIEAYRLPNSGNPVIPVGPEGFWYLYDVFNRNLRTALAFAEDFSFWLHSQYGSSARGQDMGLMESWLAEMGGGFRAEADEWLGPREWSTFDTMIRREGTCRPANDYTEYKFKSADAMRSSIRALRDSNLLTYEADEINKSRKIASLTARGWLVAYVRKGYSVPGSERGRLWEEARRV